jgi:hypothetical protein
MVKAQRSAVRAALAAVRFEREHEAARALRGAQRKLLAAGAVVEARAARVVYDDPEQRHPTHPHAVDVPGARLYLDALQRQWGADAREAEAQRARAAAEDAVVAGMRPRVPRGCRAVQRRALGAAASLSVFERLQLANEVFARGRAARAAAQAEAEAAEAAGMFKPATCARSRRLVRGMAASHSERAQLMWSAVEERLYKDCFDRRRRAEQRARRAQQELAFAPELCDRSRRIAAGADAAVGARKAQLRGELVLLEQVAAQQEAQEAQQAQTGETSAAAAPPAPPRDQLRLIRDAMHGRAAQPNAAPAPAPAATATAEGPQSAASLRARRDAAVDRLIAQHADALEQAAAQARARRRGRRDRLAAQGKARATQRKQAAAAAAAAPSPAAAPATGIPFSRTRKRAATKAAPSPSPSAASAPPPPAYWRALPGRAAAVVRQLARGDGRVDCSAYERAEGLAPLDREAVRGLLVELAERVREEWARDEERRLRASGWEAAASAAAVHGADSDAWLGRWEAWQLSQSHFAALLHEHAGKQA